MPDYALLAHPGHNRVYFENSQAMLLCEFQAMAQHMGIDGAEWKTIGGIPYVCFRSAQPLEPAGQAALARLSFFYALFQLAPTDGSPVLCPMDAAAPGYFPAGLNTILKYSGKTNEQFTTMMVNLALSCCRTGSAAPRLLDPLSGKGTTLYAGLIQGLDVAGIELNSGWWQEACTYIIKFLENGHYKHKASHETVSSDKGKKIADVFQVQTANTKQAYDSGNLRTLRMVNGDTRFAARFFKKASFDLLVADLPYGVQHAGKKANDSTGGKSVSELTTLLEESLDGWQTVLKPGGAMALSFNEFSLKKADVVAALEQHGMEVLKDSTYGDFQHRVDQGIKRNVVVAVKPGK
jgi:hypothetical protein